MVASSAGDDKELHNTSVFCAPSLIPDDAMLYPILPVNKRREYGFSLIELIISTLVISILSAVAIPRVFSTVASRRLQAAARRVSADLAYARSQAKSLGRNVEVQFSPDQNEYVMPGLRSPNGDAEYAILFAETPYPVNLESASFGGDTSVMFSLYGTADSAGSVVLTNAGQSISISLQQYSGRVEVGP